MEQELNIKVIDFLEELDKSLIIKELKIYKEKVLNDKELLSKIDKIKRLDKYSMEYKVLKLEIYKNNDYANYIRLENELNLFILELNKKINSLINKSKICNR